MAVVSSGDVSGRMRRLAASVIDLVLLGGVSLLLILLTGVYGGPEAYSGFFQFALRLVLIVCVAYGLLNSFHIFSNAQTLGKRLLGIRLVAGESGEPLSPVKLMVRAALVPLFVLVPYAMPLLLIDPLPVLGKRRLSLRDRIVGSAVHDV